MFCTTTCWETGDHMEHHPEHRFRYGEDRQLKFYLDAGFLAPACYVVVRGNNR